MRTVARVGVGRLVAALLVIGTSALGASGQAGAAGLSRATVTGHSLVPHVANGDLFVACGYQTTYTAPEGCLTLTQAITDAETGGASSPPAIVALEPGSYCPVVIPYGYRSFTIEGIGAAAVPPDTSYSGPEAALSTFTWNSAACGSTPSPYEIDLSAGYFDYSKVTIENVAVDPGTDGPDYGIYGDNGPLTVRDTLIEGASLDGIYYSSGDDEGETELDMLNDAVMGNDVGIYLLGSGGIDDTMVADNTGVGIEFEYTDASLLDDTIAENAVGVSIFTDLEQVRVSNTIVGDSTESTEDCEGEVVGQWEYGGEAGGNENNLIGSSCATGNSTDVALSDTLAAPAENGGPTPSIDPPAQAVGAADAGACGETDQRDAVPASSGGCDIGSVDSGGSLTADPTADISPLSFGTVDQGTSSVMTDDLYNGGGDLVGISGVSVTGAGYALTEDGCTDTVLYEQYDGKSCDVSVTFTPSSAGTLDGDLVFDTTAGELTVPLDGTGGPQAFVPGRPAAPKATRGNGLARLSWTAPTDGGNPITDYEIRDSTDGGSSWTDYGEVDGTSKTVDLDNYTTYLFEVAAVNGVGQGAWSPPSNQVTPGAPGDSSKIATSPAASGTYGSAVSLATALTDTKTGKPIGDTPVQLWSRPGASGAFTEVGTATTSSSGKASMSVSPAADTRYEWQFVGSPGHDPATSSITTVSVAPAVKISASSTSVKPKHATKIYGTVSPGPVGEKVVLELRKGTTWTHPSGETAVLKHQKLPSGTTEVGYVISFAEKAAGRYVLRVEVPSTSTLSAGASKQLTVTVG